MDSRSKEVSRRSVLVQGALCVTGVAAIVATNIESAKAAKLPQSAVAYRETPNGNRQCDGCKFFLKPNACQKVAGKINPKGYCVLWQKA